MTFAFYRVAEREFVYIDDLINAILAVVLHCDVLKHNTTVDIGAENEISVRRLTQLIKDIIGSSPDFSLVKLLITSQFSAQI